VRILIIDKPPRFSTVDKTDSHNNMTSLYFRIGWYYNDILLSVCNTHLYWTSPSINNDPCPLQMSYLFVLNTNAWYICKLITHSFVRLLVYTFVLSLLCILFVYNTLSLLCIRFSLRRLLLRHPQSVLHSLYWHTEKPRLRIFSHVSVRQYYF
jgi:hypothetical protein